jgi:hypothetical protein
VLRRRRLSKENPDMNASTEFEALEVTRARIEAVERRRPWLVAETTIKEERGRRKADLFFASIQRYIEQTRVEPSELM